MNTKKFSDAMSELDDKYVDEAVHYKKTEKTRKSAWVKWGAAAACFCVVAASAALANKMIQNEPSRQIEMAAPAADAPDGMRKFMNYNGSRYVFMENGAAYKLSGEQLKTVLGTLDYDIQADPQANSGKEFATTFALGATVYEMSDYDSDFRIAVEWEGNYYICQKVGLTDQTPMDVSEYFQAARFPEIIDEVFICDHMGTEMLSEFPKEETASLIDLLSQAEPAELSDEDYQQIARAQTEGDSYQLLFSLNDGTTYRLYVIPSLGIIMIGDDRYTLPESFADTFGGVFDGLSQKPIPSL